MMEMKEKRGQFNSDEMVEMDRNAEKNQVQKIRQK